MKYKMLGVVVLYKPDVFEVIENIERYALYLDRLIVWDNSPSELNLHDAIINKLQRIEDKILWHGTVENQFIAPAINFALDYANKNGYDFILSMDQDSRWLDFAKYRCLIENDVEQNQYHVYTPYIKGYDNWAINEKKQKRRIFINSGTIDPVHILNAIGGVDENFPLDALDHDTSIRIQEMGFDIVCLTECILLHTMGKPTKKRSSGSPRSKCRTRSPGRNGFQYPVPVADLRTQERLDAPVAEVAGEGLAAALLGVEADHAGGGAVGVE